MLCQKIHITYVKTDLSLMIFPELPINAKMLKDVLKDVTHSTAGPCLTSQY